VLAIAPAVRPGTCTSCDSHDEGNGYVRHERMPVPIGMVPVLTETGTPVQCGTKSNTIETITSTCETKATSCLSDMRACCL
jgi:hypothetical protein